MHKEGPQEGATNSNGHNIHQRLARDAHPLAIPHLVGEGLDLVEHLPDILHGILTIHHDFLQGQTGSEIQLERVLLSGALPGVKAML